MVDTTENAFRAAIHSLREIVMPAVNPTHPLAREQLALVVDWLEFQRSRFPLLADRQRAELRANLAMAREILELRLPLAEASLDRAAEAGQDVLADPAASYDDLQAAVTGLEEALSAAVRLAADLPEQDRRAVERVVIAGSEPITTLQRAWFLPFGLEADPQALPALEQALSLSPSPAGSRTAANNRGAAQ